MIQCINRSSWSEHVRKAYCLMTVRINYKNVRSLNIIFKTVNFQNDFHFIQNMNLDKS